MTLGDQVGDQEFLDQRTLQNAGAATLAGYNSGYGLDLSSGATFDNQAGGSFAFITDASINNNGGSPSGGTFLNERTLSKTGGTGTSIIGGGITFTETGTLQALSGTLQLSGGETLAGTVEATSGGSLVMTDPPTNLSGGTLTGATWIVGANSSLSLGATITTDSATIVFDGPGGTFSSLSGLAAIAAGGSLETLDGGSFTTAGDLDNAGTIELAPGTLNISGNYTQEAAGTLAVGIGGLSAGSQYGQMNVTEQATLNGALDINLASGYSPPLGASYRILNFGARSGNFSSEVGLVLSGTASLVPTYDSTPGPGLDLVVTHAVNTPPIYAGFGAFIQSTLERLDTIAQAGTAMPLPAIGSALNNYLKNNPLLASEASAVGAINDSNVSTAAAEAALLGKALGVTVTPAGNTFELILNGGTNTTPLSIPVSGFDAGLPVLGFTAANSFNGSSAIRSISPWEPRGRAPRVSSPKRRARITTHSI